MVEAITSICKQISLAANRTAQLVSSADMVNRFDNPNGLFEVDNTVAEATANLFLEQTMDELQHIQELSLALTGLLLPATADDDSEEHSDEDGSVFAEGDLTSEK